MALERRRRQPLKKIAQTQVGGAGGGGRFEGIGSAFFLPAFGFDTVVQGTWVIQGGGVSQWCGVLTNPPAADADEIEFDIWLNRGTYKIVHLLVLKNRAGILETRLDSTLIDTFDMYSGIQMNNYRHEISDVVIETEGAKTLTFKINGKNASALDYYLELSGTWFVRTA